MKNENAVNGYSQFKSIDQIYLHVSASVQTVSCPEYPEATDYPLPSANDGLDLSDDCEYTQGVINTQIPLVAFQLCLLVKQKSVTALC